MPPGKIHWRHTDILPHIRFSEKRDNKLEVTAINVLDRFLGTMNFEKVPPPRWYTLGYWAETIERWKQEGLPEDVSGEAYFEQEGTMGLPVRSGFCDTPLCPGFEREVLSEDDEFIVQRDSMGIVKRDRKGGVSMSQFLDFPVKTPEDWLDIKWRLDPDSPERYPADWSQIRAACEQREVPIRVNVCGAYGMPRNLFGEEHLAYAYYDYPDLLHDIEQHWTFFYKKLFSNIMEHVPVDMVYIWEDMAFKNGPLISPNAFREFMLPYYKDLISHLKRLGVKCVMVDSDGDNRVLMDMFIESGVQMFMPFEIAAGMDPVPIREKYGKQLVIWGGIDKRALSKDLDTVEREVMSKVPKMMELGGFIPSVDHAVPPDVPFENYCRYIELVKDICEG